MTAPLGIPSPASSPHWALLTGRPTSGLGVTVPLGSLLGQLVAFTLPTALNKYFYPVVVNPPPQNSVS